MSMTEQEKLQWIEDMGIDVFSSSGDCPQEFGLKNYCSAGSFKDTCYICWIKALEDQL
jgi:hypothetical protein